MLAERGNALYEEAWKMSEYGRPIRVFISNLMQWGVRLWVEDGRLVVKFPDDMEVSPMLKEEITKRASFIVDVLKPFPCGPLQKYYGRLVPQREFFQALQETPQHGYAVTGTPVALGKYLVEIEECAIQRVQGVEKKNGSATEVPYE